MYKPTGIDKKIDYIADLVDKIRLSTMTGILAIAGTGIFCSSLPEVNPTSVIEADKNRQLRLVEVGYGSMDNTVVRIFDYNGITMGCISLPKYSCLSRIQKEMVPSLNLELLDFMENQDGKLSTIAPERYRKLPEGMEVYFPIFRGIDL